MLKSISKQSYIVIAIVLIFVLVFSIAILYYFFKPYSLGYENEIVYASEKYDLEPALIASVINAESGFDANCKSSAGALGLMQIMPTTAVWLAGLMNIGYNKIQLFEPNYNIQMGSFYLSYLFEKFGELTTVLASYNAGEGNVQLWLLNSKYSSNGKEILTTPFSQTNSYIEKVFNGLDYYKEKFASTTNV